MTIRRYNVSYITFHLFLPRCFSFLANWSTPGRVEGSQSEFSCSQPYRSFAQSHYSECPLQKYLGPVSSNLSKHLQTPASPVLSWKLAGFEFKCRTSDFSVIRIKGTVCINWRSIFLNTKYRAYSHIHFYINQEIRFILCFAILSYLLSLGTLTLYYRQWKASFAEEI